MRQFYKFSCVIVAIAMFCLAVVPASVAIDDSWYTVSENTAIELCEDQAIQEFTALLNHWTTYDSNGQKIMSYPEYYGGAYINDNKSLTIQVTELTRKVIEDLGSIVDLKNITFETVSYSYNTLLFERDRVAKQMHLRSSVVEIVGVGIQASTNSINIYVYDPDNKLESRTHNSNDISTFPNKALIAMTEKPSVCAAVEPGSPISNRSVGFWARNADGDLGIVTAPHSSISEGDTIRINGTVFGVAETPYFSGYVDAVFIKRTNSTFTPTRSITGFNFGLSTRTYVAMPEGAMVYSKGISTETDTGTVVERDFVTSYGVTGARATNECRGGDSGGIVAGGGNGATRYVAGIVTGRYGSESVGSLIYVEASDIVSTLDITIY